MCQFTKGGDKEEPLNYKPVLLSSVVAKICEKIVKDIWLKFLEEINTHSMIKQKLEYAEVICSPHKKKNVLKLEWIQRIATKMVPDLEVLIYEERSKAMHLTTQEERRERGDNYNI